MAENYTVNYQINVNAQPALNAIQKFQQATIQMEKLVGRFDMVARSVGKVNSALASISSKPVNIQINTSQAETNLKRVLGLLGQIKTQTKIAVSGAIKTTGGTKATTTVTGASSLSTRSANSDLRTLMATIKKTQTSIDNINKRYIHPKADTKNAQASLDKLLQTINAIKNSRNIKIVATGGKSVGNTASRISQSSATGTAPKRVTGTKAGASSYLFPSTRQVLGPTYANTGANVAGEMVKGMGIAYGLSSLMSGITTVFRDASQYDNITQTTRNILATHDKGIGFDARFDEMNNLMRQVGVETKYTAPQVAEAGKFLAMAGFNVDQIKQSIRPISDIALVGDTDLGETADVVTNIMTAYEIPARKMNNASDVLTMTFTKTNTTLMELAESFKYAGTVAHQAGLSFETSSAVFGILGDAGVKGSHAGTTLRMILTNMMNPTKKQQAAWNTIGVSTKDSDGNLRNLPDILRDLHDKSKAMSAGDFTTLISQMFRVTATPGALALINNVGKLQEVVDKNYMSYGLASELAGEKKNTIQGLWYQMTSAFTESGMQGFEEMQGAIRGFLQRMIQLMKSPEFAEALKGMMDMFMKIINVVVDVFKRIMQIWNIIPNWAKNGLVSFVKIQMILSIAAGISQSILSTWIMIRGVAMGSWLSSAFLKPLSSVLVYMLRLYSIQKNILHLSKGQAIWNTLSGSLLHVQRGVKKWWRSIAIADSAVTLGSTVANGSSKAAGWLSKAANASPLGLGKLLFSMSKWGWFTGALVGIMALSYQIYQTYKITEAARKANEAWGQSYRNLGVDKLDLSDPDTLMIGNMRIFNNELLTQNERVAQSIELWHRYWIEKNGPKEQKKDETKFTDVDQKWKEQLKVADAWFGVDKAFSPLINVLGGKLSTETNLNGNKTTYLNLYGRKILMNGEILDTGNGVSEKGAIQLLLAKYGADPNNEQRVALEKFLINQVSSAHSYSDYLNIIEGAKKKFVPTGHDYNPKWDWISSETAEEMTWGDIQESQMYIKALQGNMEQALKTWNDFADLIKDADAGKNIDPMNIQQILHSRFNILFDTSKGLFGTENWKAYVQDIISHPDKYNFSSFKSATEHIIDVFDKLVSWYNLLDYKYKPLFAQFLNRTSWENVLPDVYNLPEGGYEAGQKEGDKMTVGGKEYTWTYNGVIENGGMWLDKDGKVFTPTNAKMTQTWTPNLTGDNPLTNLHNGADQSEYRSHYNNSAVPKQVIVRIENLMRVDKQMIDMTDERQVAAIANIKQELATALLDVVQDFNANMV